MEPQVPGRMPRAGLLLLPLLLCFGPETAGSIDPVALRVIVDYVNKPLTLGERQYTFVVSLPREKCDQPTNLQEQLPKEALNAMNQALTEESGQYIPDDWPIVAARPRREKTHSEHREWRLLHGDKNSSTQNVATYLPKHQLKEMRKTIRPFNGLYNPPSGNIVAARPKKVNTTKGNYTEHSEWRLLSGQNSLVAQLKARTYGQNSCLILFTLNSPCSTKCLREAGRSNIVNMTNYAFSDIDSNYKAFVFQKIFDYDMKAKVTSQDLLQAWHRLRDVPLLRCDNNGCQDCAGDDTSNPCLAGKE